MPPGSDARTAHAFDEVSQFVRSANLPSVEETRRAQAMRFAQVELAELFPSPVEPAMPAKRRRGAGSSTGPKWRIAEGAAPVLALANNPTGRTPELTSTDGHKANPSLNPDLEQAYLLMAQAADLRGKTQEALDWMERADPRH